MGDDVFFGDGSFAYDESGGDATESDHDATNSFTFDTNDSTGGGGGEYSTRLQRAEADHHAAAYDQRGGGGGNDVMGTSTADEVAQSESKEARRRRHEHRSSSSRQHAERRHNHERRSNNDRQYESRRHRHRSRSRHSDRDKHHASSYSRSSHRKHGRSEREARRAREEDGSWYVTDDGSTDMSSYGSSYDDRSSDYGSYDGSHSYDDYSGVSGSSGGYGNNDGLETTHDTQSNYDDYNTAGDDESYVYDDDDYDDESYADEGQYYSDDYYESRRRERIGDSSNHRHVSTGRINGNVLTEEDELASLGSHWTETNASAINLLSQTMAAAMNEFVKRSVQDLMRAETLAASFTNLGSNDGGKNSGGALVGDKSNDNAVSNNTPSGGGQILTPLQQQAQRSRLQLDACLRRVVLGIDAQVRLLPPPTINGYPVNTASIAAMGNAANHMNSHQRSGQATPVMRFNLDSLMPTASLLYTQQQRRNLNGKHTLPVAADPNNNQQHVFNDAVAQTMIDYNVPVLLMPALQRAAATWYDKTQHPMQIPFNVTCGGGGGGRYGIGTTSVGPSFHETHVLEVTQHGVVEAPHHAQTIDLLALVYYAWQDFLSDERLVRQRHPQQNRNLRLSHHSPVQLEVNAAEFRDANVILPLLEASITRQVMLMARATCQCMPDWERQPTPIPLASTWFVGSRMEWTVREGRVNRAVDDRLHKLDKHIRASLHRQEDRARRAIHHDNRRARHALLRQQQEMAYEQQQREDDDAYYRRRRGDYHDDRYRDGRHHRHDERRYRDDGSYYDSRDDSRDDYYRRGGRYGRRHRYDDYYNQRATAPPYYGGYYGGGYPMQQYAPPPIQQYAQQQGFYPQQQQQTRRNKQQSAYQPQNNGFYPMQQGAPSQGYYPPQQMFTGF